MKILFRFERLDAVCKGMTEMKRRARHKTRKREWETRGLSVMDWIMLKRTQSQVVLGLPFSIMRGRKGG